jgi:hypothetical protein
VTLVSHSLDLIRRLQAPTGAYPASPTFSAYRGYSGCATARSSPKG